jgi:hypothetical protein
MDTRSPALPAEGGLGASTSALTDWTLIVTAIGTASVTGIVGYGTAKLNTRTELRRIEAENERLRAQHREDHLRNRQGTYHLLLNVDRQYTDAILRRENPRPWQRAFHDAAMGVVLFGTEAARDAMNAVILTYADVWSEAIEQTGGSEPAVTPAALLDAWHKLSSEMNARKDALLQAMRDDVGPGS